MRVLVGIFVMVIALSAHFAMAKEPRTSITLAEANQAATLVGKDIGELFDEGSFKVRRRCRIVGKTARCRIHVRAERASFSFRVKVKNRGGVVAVYGSDLRSRR